MLFFSHFVKNDSDPAEAWEKIVCVCVCARAHTRAHVHAHISLFFWTASNYTVLKDGIMFPFFPSYFFHPDSETSLSPLLSVVPREGREFCKCQGSVNADV